MTKRKDELIQWIKNHSFELMVVGVSVAAAIAIVLLARNTTVLTEIKGSLKSLLETGPIKGQKPAHKIDSIIRESQASFQKTKPVDVIRVDQATKGLKGNRLTATELGRKVNNASAQEINKRLVNAGLAERSPGGYLSITEKGRPYAEIISRKQPWGFEAYIPGWDEKVLDIIYTESERMAIAEREKEIARIVANTMKAS